MFTFFVLSVARRRFLNRFGHRPPFVYHHTIERWPLINYFLITLRYLNPTLYRNNGNSKVTIGFRAGDMRVFSKGKTRNILLILSTENSNIFIFILGMSLFSDRLWIFGEMRLRLTVYSTLIVHDLDWESGTVGFSCL